MKTFYYDTETELIRPAHLAPKLICFQWAEDFEDAVLWHAKFDREKILERFTRALREDLIVGHNVAFDMAVMIVEFPELLELVFQAYSENRVVCTMQRQRLLDLAEGQLDGYMWIDGKNTKRLYSLEFLAKIYANIELDKNTWRLRYGELYDTPIDQWEEGARAYALDDARVARIIFRKQGNGNERLLRDQFRQSRAAWWIHLMMCWGMRTDAEKIDAWEKSVREKLVDVEALVRSAGIVRADGSKNTKLAKELMVSRLGLAAPLTDTGFTKAKAGAPVDRAFVLKYASLDEEACRDSGDPALEAYAKYTSLSNMLSKDVPAVRQGVTYPIQSKFTTLMSTGRTSSSGGINDDKSSLFTYQVQNLRREPGLRECFRARPRYVLIARDYSGMELHTWAQCCLTLLGYSDLAKALNAGLDAHLLFACSFMLDGMPYEEAKKLKKEARVKEARQASKAGNFGFPGGLGHASFMAYAKGTYGVILDEHGAKKLRNQWKAQWAEAGGWLEFINKQMNQQTKKTTIEQLFVGRIRANCSYTEAANGFFQALAADAAKAAGYEIARQAYTVKSSPLYGCRLWNFVHDEFILEAPEDQAHDAYMQLGKIMEEEAAKFCPDVPPRTEGAMMIHWSKNAEEVRNENGIVIPYERKAA